MEPMAKHRRRDQLYLGRNVSLNLLDLYWMIHIWKVFTTNLSIHPIIHKGIASIPSPITYQYSQKVKYFFIRPREITNILLYLVEYLILFLMILIVYRTKYFIWGNDDNKYGGRDLGSCYNIIEKKLSV